MQRCFALCVVRMEVQEHMSRAAQQCQRVTELEELLDKVKTRVQDLEDRYLSKAVQQHSHTQQLQKEKLDAHVGHSAFYFTVFKFPVNKRAFTKSQNKHTRSHSYFLQLGTK